MGKVYLDPLVCRVFRPLRMSLMAFAISCFVGTFLTDFAYAKTFDTMWANFSDWLLTTGLFVAAVAVLAGVLDFLAGWRTRNLRAVWMRATGEAAALAIAIVNAFVHGRDAYTAIVPTGIILSSIVVVVLLITTGVTATAHRI
jgi:uncharacterized membrane protein